ncbi:sensor histidine kinase [Paenibacillus oryzisoli]|uniref:cache domain-containing sensor histidine kinase n=1 Tax=Paenibacillus oryzisoli TaxID=1850517 RepID=UPI003D28D93B
MKPKKIFLPLRSKFIFLFFMLITIPFLLSGYMTYRLYSQNVEADARAYTRQIIDQITINLDRYIKDMDRLTLAPYYDSNATEILNAHLSTNHTNGYVKTDENLKMNFMITSLAIDRNEIQGIMIFSNDGIIFSNLQESISQNWDYASNRWMDEVVRADGGLVVIPPHQVNYYFGENKTVVSIARVIRDATTTSKHLGIVKIDLSEKGFEKILASASFSKNSHIYVSDRQGHQLYPLHEDPAQYVTDNHVSMVGETYLTAVEQSDYTGMVVTGLIPQSDMQAGPKQLIRFTILISLGAILVAYFIAGIASGRLVKPIRHLQSKMKKVQKGDFTERAKVTTYDEIGQLTEGFNVMVMEIERLVKEVYESNLREREAEFYALQSQINPHFIYNTLESINTLSLRSQQYEVSSLVVNLGRLLRYTVDKNEKHVYLGDEIAFVESYLEIQSSRLGLQLRTEFDVDMGHESLLIPKLILQPLVENVIEHALGEEPVTVTISTAMEQEDLVIRVQDDGAGMTAERRVQVEKGMYAGQGQGQASAKIARFGEKKKEFALRNVHMRLILLYGEGYGLFIRDVLARGTLFEIRIPLRFGEEG